MDSMHNLGNYNELRSTWNDPKIDDLKETSIMYEHY